MNINIPEFSLVVLIADQATKRVVSSRMELHDTIPVVEGFFHLTYVRNPGAAFGFFSGRDSLPMHIAFYAASILAFGVLAAVYRLQGKGASPWPRA